MDKPKPKREVTIDLVLPYAGAIQFYASPDAVEDFKTFGAIHQFSCKENYYQIQVDKRYDFDEVRQYIEQYDKE